MFDFVVIARHEAISLFVLNIQTAIINYLCCFFSNSNQFQYTLHRHQILKDQPLQNVWQGACF